MSASVPSGWKIASLGELASAIQYGYTEKAQAEKVGPHFLRITDIQDNSVDWDSVPFCAIPNEKKEKYLLRQNDIVFARTGATVGKSFLISNSIPESVFASYLIRVRPGPEVDPKYVAYYFQSPDYWRQISESKAGIGQPNVNGKKLAQIRVPVAPLDQQIQIVAEIEKQFSRLDEAVTNLHRVKANLKRYKASVLKATVEGRLVETEASIARREGRTYETGEQLLQRILETRRSQWRGKGKYKEPAPPEISDLPRIPEGWVWTTLGSILLDIEAGKSFKCEERPPAIGETGVVKVSAVTWGEFDESESKTCLDEALINKNLLIRHGDFLFSRANTIELVGACVIAKKLTINVMLSDKILRFRLLGGLDEWVLYNLRSTFGRNEIERLATGNQDSMRNIGQERIRAIRIPLPPLREINRIVAEIERRLSLEAESENQLEAIIKRANLLRQSILTSAFGGD